MSDPANVDREIVGLAEAMFRNSIDRGAIEYSPPELKREADAQLAAASIFWERAVRWFNRRADNRDEEEPKPDPQVDHTLNGQKPDNRFPKLDLRDLQKWMKMGSEIVNADEARDWLDRLVEALAAEHGVSPDVARQSAVLMVAIYATTHGDAETLKRMQTLYGFQSHHFSFLLGR